MAACCLPPPFHTFHEKFPGAPACLTHKTTHTCLYLWLYNALPVISARHSSQDGTNKLVTSPRWPILMPTGSPQTS
ncbi:hypothetical protein M441DRAFT_455093 [Trichoderma asperellum CBS 433.97]|uniref:Uncharacterized protein n=1 Tax=Trichoderma asperellum (strain ATCC 204424 / CBS 433.97 / NBRC 101777) TaxID=1042311 RepID=A0A2T3ZEG1_TRIA4|nr:hypothetical protein M441DRAFT_455093 [Trichoderma asperellum CBS 433.97]PTB43184.1 hypothetical protein M441DRAFT_455093 [Trichoderma asperellum CBS 433.97]